MTTNRSNEGAAMTNIQSTPVSVTIAVTVNGETKVFTADATTESNPFRVVEGILTGLERDAQEWLREQRNAAVER